MQSRNSVYLLLSFVMCSFVTKILTEGNKAVLFEMIIPKLLLIIDSVDEVIVEADPNKTAMIVKVAFFFFKLLY